MGSKPWLYPASTYRNLETFWDTDEDGPGPRCGHTLTAVAATKTQGPRLILFGGATAIEGGSSSAPGISKFLHKHSICFLFRFWRPEFRCFNNFAGLAGVTNTVHSYDVQTRKWIRWVYSPISQFFIFLNSAYLCVFSVFFFFCISFKKIKDGWIGTKVMIFLLSVVLNRLESRLLLGLLMQLPQLVPWLFFRWLSELRLLVGIGTHLLD